MLADSNVEAAEELARLSPFALAAQHNVCDVSVVCYCVTKAIWRILEESYSLLLSEPYKWIWCVQGATGHLLSDSSLE